jgi:hypothetical protein
MPKIIFASFLVAFLSSNAQFSISFTSAGGYVRAVRAKVINNNVGFSKSCDAKKNDFVSLNIFNLSFKRPVYDFTTFFGILYNNVKPETDSTVNLKDFNNTIVPTNINLKTRGVSLMLGLEVCKKKGKINIAYGAGFTFTGYKSQFSNPAIADDKIIIKTKNLKIFGAMPFAKVGYNFGKMSVFGMLGYQFSIKVKLNKVPANGPNQVANQIANAVYNQAKTGTIKSKIGNMLVCAGASFLLKNKF